MLERLRTRLAALISPTSSPSVEAPAPVGVGSVDPPTPGAGPLGLRAVERKREAKLEALATDLRALDPRTRERVIAVARPRRVGRRQIIPRAEAEQNAWYNARGE